MTLPAFPPEFLDLPDEELGGRLLAWWIAYQAEERGIPIDAITEDVAERIRAASVDMNIDSAAHVSLEKALRLAAGGDFARAGKLLRQRMLDGAQQEVFRKEALSGTVRQRERARRDRIDALQALIIGIMRRKPQTTVNEMPAELRKFQGQGVIETVQEEDGIIEWSDKRGGAKSAPFSGLKDRMSRARKKIQLS